MNNLSAVETAQKAVEEAKQKFESVKQAISQGDEKIQSSDLKEAKDELEFCELRLQAALSRDKKREETDNRDLLIALQSDLAKLSDTSPVDKLLDPVRKSLEKYLIQVIEYNQSITEIRSKLENGGYMIGYNNVIADLPGTQNYGETGIGNVTAKTINAPQNVKTLIESEMRKYFPGQYT